MNHRITITTLREAVERLNRVTREDTYTLDAAYGGYRLCQKVGPHGGERDLSDRASARETYSVINAYIKGYDAGLTRFEHVNQALEKVVAANTPN